MIVQGSFILVFHTHTHTYDLIWLITFRTYSFSIILLSLSSRLQCILLYCLYTQMHYVSISFILSHSLFLSCLHVVSWDRPMIIIIYHVLSLIYIYIYIYIYTQKI
jgi:hypothetical protein